MNCLIDSALQFLVNRNKSLKVIRRYIRMKYKINIDERALEQRLLKLLPSIRLSV